MLMEQDAFGIGAMPPREAHAVTYSGEVAIGEIARFVTRLRVASGGYGRSTGNSCPYRFVYSRTFSFAPSEDVHNALLIGEKTILATTVRLEFRHAHFGSERRVIRISGKRIAIQAIVGDGKTLGTGSE